MRYPILNEPLNNHNKNLIDKRFGRLVVTEYLGKYSINNSPVWKCKCDCGNYTEATTRILGKGHKLSCGCFNKEQILKANTSHGMTNTRIWDIWNSMRYRCQNPKDYNYKYYGERGISVCKEWKENFINFYNWAMSNGYNDNLTIDRIDVNGNYCPENCRWVDMVVQGNNTRRNIWYKGKTLAQWCRENGWEYNKVYQHYYHHSHSLEETINYYLTK